MYMRDMQFVQNSFLVLVGNLLFQSCGNILSFPLIFVSWYINKRLWLQAIVWHWESINCCALGISFAPF